jgi:hypothetical protein
MAYNLTPIEKILIEPVNYYKEITDNIAFNTYNEMVKLLTSMKKMSLLLQIYKLLETNEIKIDSNINTNNIKSDDKLTKILVKEINKEEKIPKQISKNDEENMSKENPKQKVKLTLRV